MNIAIGPKLPLTLDKKNGFLVIDNYADEIKQNLKILFLTAPGERVFDKNFGVGARNFLFENPTPRLSQELQSRIRSQISTYLPIIKIINMKIVVDSEIDNLFYLLFEYNIPSLNIDDRLTLTFD